MNGISHGAAKPVANGAHYYENANGQTSKGTYEIVEALETVHNPRSSSNSRKQASACLEEAKTHSEAPYHGFTLASDKSQPSIVRHFGLSLLEHAIRHRWVEYSDAQLTALRDWVVQFAFQIDEHDPPYIQNKSAQLWAEVAKRSWASEWMDMDELLIRLWVGPLVQKELVLSVLETLSEDIFNSEDTTAALRGHELSKACVDIFTPAAVLAEHFPAREKNNNVRSGDEGWLIRIGELLHSCVANGIQDDQMKGCAVKALATLRAAIGWAIPKAIMAARCVEHMCKCLAAPSASVQMASIEAMHTLFCRSHFQSDEFLAIVCPMYRGETISLLRNLYDWSIVNPADIDEVKYALAKKLSEVLSNLGNFIEEKPLLVPENSDLPGFLNLLFSILRNQSLLISIPVLNTWVKLLKSDTIGGSDAVSPLVGSLLETCSQRLFRYEALPDDSVEPSFLFLNEDIDTVPERHAFLGNYRRYCVQVVEIIVRRKPFDAMYHILGQVDDMLENLYENQPPFQMETYTKNSVAVLRVDAHFTVVEAALTGYVKWVSAHGSSPQQDEHERNTMEANFEKWCQHLLRLNFQDPLVRKRVIQVVVEFSTKAMDKMPSFALSILEHILVTRPVDNFGFPAYSDAIKELQNGSTHELHRLAMWFPDYFISVYGELEARINDIVNTETLDDRQTVSYYTFLFIITHRSTSIDQNTRETRLQGFLAPIKRSWQDPELTGSLSSFEGFCALLGMSKVQDYLASRRVHEIADWSSAPLDAEGQAIQTALSGHFQQLPLRRTKAFLAQSNDKLKKGSQPYLIACALWQDTIPLILPNLLQLLSHAHAFHNPENWSGLRPETQMIVRRVLTDRFWQAGISTGSKDDFYARVSGTKSTLEGFASSIRGTIRMIRETCYSILFCMSRLDEHFYGFKELPGPLAHGLFADAHALSSHQMSVLLNMVRFLIDDCPVHLRNHFLPPIIATMFTQIDSKVSSEWEEILKKSQSTSEEDNLTDEMKEESILRQLTFTAVTTVASLLDPQRGNPPDAESSSKTSRDQTSNSNPTTMRNFVLSSPTILEPLILFCTHALRMRDSRCCGVITRVFRSIVPEFAGDTPIASEIREFISTEVLKACITSLHEPYFVDLQKDLAQLIATIFILYSSKTNTPRQIILSLPGITEEKFELVAQKVMRVSSGRQQRALILDLLEGLRGVSISEQGKIKRDVKKERSAMQERYMNVDEQANSRTEGSPDLGGVADMFG
ncbi:MAG: hypothetical protein M1827_001633 [Pycnora praestabilis]|nr:MAG: hypothetical protein M1827_001633 [Pycnora praestabilis]